MIDQAAIWSDDSEMQETFAKTEGVPVVYLLWNGATTLLKIGRTEHLKRRMFTIGLACGAPVDLLSYRAAFGRSIDLTRDESRWLEDSLHRRFRRYRILGEWFADRREIREAFGVDW